MSTEQLVQLAPSLGQRALPCPPLRLSSIADLSVGLGIHYWHMVVSNIAELEGQRQPLIHYLPFLNPGADAARRDLELTGNLSYGVA
jgi:hypothetical protein